MSATPRLAVSCSSPGGATRVQFAAEQVLGRMPPDMAADLCGRVMIFAVDRSRHFGFAQGFADSATAQLAHERVRQGRVGGDFVVITLCLSPTTWVEHIIAHELGHVHLGHCDMAATATLSADESEANERAAEEFAFKYAR